MTAMDSISGVGTVAALASSTPVSAVPALAFETLWPALPEISLALMATVLLLFGLFQEKRGFIAVSWLSVAVLAAIMVYLARCAGCEPAQEAFEGMFVMDGFGAFMKMLVLGGAAVSILMSLQYLRQEGMARFEYPVLVLFSVTGMMMMISANDLMALYIGLELQSLPLYVLAAFRRDYARSSEAGIKYFVLGALSSGLLLYGASLIYGFSGVTRFDLLSNVLGNLQGDIPLGVLIGMVMMICGMAFKISAVPFHMWTPDVYEGAPTSVTAFFAIAPKVAGFALMMRVLLEPFGMLADEWQQVIVLLSIASMALGSIAAIQQKNIKRLMAYSSIGHMGYALMGLAAASEGGAAASLTYLSIYMVMNIGMFAVILSMARKDRMLEDISDLSGLAGTRPVLAVAMTVLLFSMAGIPPLAGFFGKLFVFKAAVEGGYYTLAILGVLSSVIAAYYYLRIIKVMYFDDPVEDINAVQGVSGAVILAACGFVLLFIAWPQLVVESAEAAASSLFAI